MVYLYDEQDNLIFSQLILSDGIFYYSEDFPTVLIQNQHLTIQIIDITLQIVNDTWNFQYEENMFMQLTVRYANFIELSLQDDFYGHAPAGVTAELVINNTHQFLQLNDFGRCVVDVTDSYPVGTVFSIILNDTLQEFKNVHNFYNIFIKKGQTLVQGTFTSYAHFIITCKLVDINNQPMQNVEVEVEKQNTFYKVETNYSDQNGVAFFNLSEIKYNLSTASALIILINVLGYQRQQYYFLLMRQSSMNSFNFTLVQANVSSLTIHIQKMPGPLTHDITALLYYQQKLLLRSEVDSISGSAVFYYGDQEVFVNGTMLMIGFEQSEQVYNISGNLNIVYSTNMTVEYGLKYAVTQYFPFVISTFDNKGNPLQCSIYLTIDGITSMLNQTNQHGILVCNVSNEVVDIYVGKEGTVEAEMNAKTNISYNHSVVSFVVSESVTYVNLILVRNAEQQKDFALKVGLGVPTIVVSATIIAVSVFMIIKKRKLKLKREVLYMADENVNSGMIGGDYLHSQ